MDPPPMVRLFYERPGPQLRVRLLKLLVRVHHDRAAPGDRLFERLAGDEQETDALIAGLHDDLVAAIEEYERAIADSVELAVIF